MSELALDEHRPCREAERKAEAAVADLARRLEEALDVVKELAGEVRHLHGHLPSGTEDPTYFLKRAEALLANSDKRKEEP